MSIDIGRLGTEQSKRQKQESEGFRQYSEY